MILLGIRPKADAPRIDTHTKCTSRCAALEDPAHMRRHLLEDLAKAHAEATRQGRRLWMRFAVLEQHSGAMLRDELVRCSYQESQATLASACDADTMSTAIRSLVEECPGTHLSELRDIYLTAPPSIYIIYEVEVEPGFQLPSN